MSEPKLVQTGDLLTISTDAPVTVPLFAIKTRKELCDWLWYLGTQPGIDADMLLGFLERVHEYKAGRWAAGRTTATRGSGSSAKALQADKRPTGGAPC